MDDTADTAENLDTLRRKIGEKLASGLETQAFPRAETAEQVNRIVERLRPTWLFCH